MKRTTLRFIDPNFSRRSPSMKNLIECIPALRKAGFRLVAWSIEKDDDIEGVEWVKMPRFALLNRVFAYLPYFVCVQVHAFWRWLRRAEPEIVYSTGYTGLRSDFSLIHFSNFDWLRAQCRLSLHGWRDYVKLLWTLQGVVTDWLLLWNPFCKRLYAVSDAMAEHMERHAPAGKKIGVLPNPYLKERYNVEKRKEWRDKRREELGYGSEEKVFIFASMGHYKRKGFWLAVEALERLRKRGRPVRFLILGGYEETLKELQKDLPEGWEEWIAFAGIKSDMETWYAAGDALLLPSHSEALVLVSVECAAMGLRLYLTRFIGSEMVLEPGENGEFLPWEPEGMAEVLDREIAESQLVVGEGIVGRVPSFQEYERRVLEIVEELSVEA